MRVSGLLNCGLQIPSLEAGRSFYTDFGLEVSEQGNALAVRCTGRDQDQVILTEGPRKRLDHVAFAVEPGSLPDWQRHLEGLGVRLLYIGDGLWFEDEEGNLVRLRDTGLAPWRPFPPEAFNVAVEAFYTRALGLRLSDRVPGKATFLNSGPGDHHVFGFVQSTHPGLHHTSFEVANIDQLGMGAQLMAANGHREGWGLGRHSLGSNLFHYIRDPWGSWIEYFTDIDRITEDWIPREWQTPPAVWCPLMPEQFLINLEDRP